jgi:hypothetical protein
MISFLSVAIYVLTLEMSDEPILAQIGDWLCTLNRDPVMLTLGTLLLGLAALLASVIPGGAREHSALFTPAGGVEPWWAL